MKFVLGIDAAWTDKEPSGVALLSIDEGNYIKAIKLARSYEEFCCDSINWNKDVNGSLPQYDKLLEFCNNNQLPVDLFALDIPISPVKITGRRESDSQISKKYGGYGAATHSPNEIRPGYISEIIFSQLKELGYEWNGGRSKSFIEVYPHTGIIELFHYNYRLPYKVQKRSKYWPNSSSEQRLRNIILNLNELRQNLVKYIPNLAEKLHELSPYKTYSVKYLKGYEDLLDAIVCSLTGCFYLMNKAKGYGDRGSTIWVPRID